MGLEEKSHGAARRASPPPPPPELLEDDEETVTGVVHIAHQSADTLTRDVDAQRDKINASIQALREKLSNSGPIARRPRKPAAAR